MMQWNLGVIGKCGLLILKPTHHLLFVSSSTFTLKWADGLKMPQTFVGLYKFNDSVIMYKVVHPEIPSVR